MSAYFRISKRTGISLPWWLIPLAALVWVTGAVIYWLAMVAVAGVILTVRWVQRLL